MKEVKAGRVDYKVDKNANISAAVGKLSFSNESIAENIAALIDSVVKARPASAKGAYIESVTVSCAMCPGQMCIRDRPPAGPLSGRRSRGSL